MILNNSAPHMPYRFFLRSSTLLASMFAMLVLLLGCGNTKETPNTLGDIDISEKKRIVIAQEKEVVREKKSQEEVRQAYEKYVQTASSHDISRQKALTRLAQLELELSNSLTKTEKKEEISSAMTSSLKRTIELLETTLRDYPNAKGNDKVLYQLAQAYDRAGEYNKSLSSLKTLIRKFPKSLFYAEAQFRLGEASFVRGDYITAEDSYTEVVLTPGSDKFYEKSLFKRGWTRYKQELYTEAIDDYADAMEYHRFQDRELLTDSEESQFNEYLRALGLAFSYVSGQTIKDYFDSRGDFKYVYDIYDMVANIYLKQERYSDAAVTLEEFAKVYPDHNKTPLAELKIIAAWQEGNFISRLYQSIERFYNNYQPNANYWKQNKNEAIYEEANKNLRRYITQVTSYFHSRYREKSKRADYQQAKVWYERYLNHYTAYANKDNIYSLYAELLLDGNQSTEALKYFSLAAYDGDIILDKKAAYSTIVISSSLLTQTEGSAAKSDILNQHLTYAQRYVDLYPKDKRSLSIATSAAERAFNAKQYDKAIELANFVPDTANEKVRFNANNIKARAFLEQNQYADAESVYLELLDANISNRKTRNTIKDSLALSIYRQGEEAQKANQIDLALSHFTRIARIIPDASLSATGWYDAIAIAMQNKMWNQSIGLINEFKTRFPKHERTADVTKKLSVAYLNSDQKGKAAQEFEAIAKFEGNLEVKMAALWQAAELYESKNNLEGAIRTYRDYAHTYKKPYEQNMEAMYKLSDLYGKLNQPQKRYFWQNKIVRADQKATKRDKTDRTTYIASTTTLNLARDKREEFAKRKLVEPLAKNLKLKKSAMQESVKLYGIASSYGIEEITTEATNAIGDIYFDFSNSLLESERPTNLSADELDQYEILLEDQAFPFEEKAIEFYEANMVRTQNDTFDKWVERSLEQLKALFPVRYTRKGKVDVVTP